MVPEAGEACAGECVLGSGHSRTPSLGLGTLTPPLHGSSALLTIVPTPGTVTPGQIKPAGSISHWSHLPTHLAHLGPPVELSLVHLVLGTLLLTLSHGDEDDQDQQHPGHGQHDADQRWAECLHGADHRRVTREALMMRQRSESVYILTLA